MSVVVKAINPITGEAYDYIFRSLEANVVLALAWRDTLDTLEDTWNDFDGYEASHSIEEIEGVDIETLCLYPCKQRHDGTIVSDTCDCVWSQEWEHEISEFDKSNRAKWRQDERDRLMIREALLQERNTCTSYGSVKPTSNFPVVLWPSGH